jgi:hypothetical protein
MTLDRFGRRGLARLSLAVLLSLAPAAACGGEALRTAAAAQTKGEAIDADMLRDLDVSNNANYARDREIAKRMSLFERLRVLQGLPSASSQPQPEGATPPAASAKGR